jgi:hypothetical protein
LWPWNAVRRRRYFLHSEGAHRSMPAGSCVSAGGNLVSIASRPLAIAMSNLLARPGPGGWILLPSLYPSFLLSRCLLIIPLLTVNCNWPLKKTRQRRYVSTLCAIPGRPALADIYAGNYYGHSAILASLRLYPRDGAAPRSVRNKALKEHCDGTDLLCILGHDPR